MLYQKQNPTDTHDFGEGSTSGNILRLAIPMTLAQLINVLYNIIDRIYIGHLPDVSTQALTGIGLTLPVITIITAFANLFGMGGAPLFLWQEVPVNLGAPGKFSATPFPCS